MVHTCNTAIIHCMDFRIIKSIREYMEENNLLNDCDVISIAGGVKALLSPKNPSDRDFVFDQINTSVVLHKISEIILCNHTDCGAYKGTVSFGNFEEDCLFHINEMKKAGNVILSKFPGLQVKMLLGKILSDDRVKLEEIQ
jgi:carbonic anhydrase